MENGTQRNPEQLLIISFTQTIFPVGKIPM
jgi:hypothetical protein